MPITIAQMLQGMASSGEGASDAVNQKRSDARKSDNEAKQAKLKSYLEGQNQAREIDQVRQLQDYFGKKGLKINTKVGNVDVSQAPVAPSIMLTPAQDAAEKEAGKKISDFEGGGQQAGVANIGQVQDVTQDLQQGKRDSYDRFVGGALENHPTLMGLAAPTEKARRDKIQNAFLSALHDAGIPRPTQWDIQRVFGQVYDPSSDDKSNVQRLTQATSKLQAHQQALQQQANQYHQTGYATIGQPAAPTAPAQAPQAPGFDPDAFLKGQ